MVRADMSSVSISRAGPVTTVMISRPEARNAVDRETASELAEAFSAFDADPLALVGVLCGDSGHFCAGADLSAVARGDPNRLEPEGTAPMGPTRMLLSKPVIAAISGYAVAGGLELALWCDMRIMEEDATLGVFCRRWGVPLIDGGTVRLPRLIGQSRALDLILTGRPVGAEEALAIGLVNRVVPPGRARETAETLGAEIAVFPQDCLRGDRASVYAQWELPLDAALAHEFQLGMRVIDRGGAQQGALEFMRMMGHTER
jgi:enoyl-CoA hydratase